MSGKTLTADVLAALQAILHSKQVRDLMGKVVGTLQLDCKKRQVTVHGKDGGRQQSKDNRMFERLLTQIKCALGDIVNEWTGKLRAIKLDGVSVTINTNKASYSY